MPDGCRFVLVAMSDVGGVSVRHALPLDKRAGDAVATLCDVARPREGWETTGYTSFAELIGCLDCRQCARTAIAVAYPLG